MSDLTNLIYNGDLTRGSLGWGSASVSDGILTKTGNLYNDILIPVSSNDTYKLSFDLKVTKNCGDSFYIAMIMFDSAKSEIGVSYVQKSVSGTETTLAKELKNGDTTVTLTSGANWYNSTPDYRKQIGLCNNIAWGYSRSTYNQYYSSVSGNVLTLKSTWAGGTIPAGTKVANFTDGGTYYYPWYAGSSSLPTDWKTYTVTFKGGNSMRATAVYTRFSTLGYSHTYQMRNIRMENTTSHQILDLNSVIKPNISKNGVINNIPYINSIGMNIRYIRDSINGSTANGGNHWVEIKALDIVGNNIAFNKNAKFNNGSYTKNYITDGVISTSPYSEGSSPVTVDLGFVTKICKLQIWHYWGDGRTYYNNEVEVSEDGTNWITVYNGTHPETSDGFEIILSPNKVRLYKTGLIDCNEFIEY